MGMKRHEALAGLVMMTACFSTRVETMSQPTTVHLRLTNTCQGAFVVEAQTEHARFSPIALEGANADVTIPAMQGGYTDRGGHISNEANPNTYPAVRVREGDRVLRELSLDQIKQLPRDADGRAIVRVAC